MGCKVLGIDGLGQATQVSRSEPLATDDRLDVRVQDDGLERLGSVNQVRSFVLLDVPVRPK